MTISYRKALLMGMLSILLLVALQAWSSVQCYHHDAFDFALMLGAFVLVPLIPSLIALLTPNPLAAVGGSVFFAPWMGYAYYKDCINPDADGGSSMVYVLEMLYGSGSCLLGVLLLALLMRLAGIQVVKRRKA